MSIIHVNQIRGHLENAYNELIDLIDVEKSKDEQKFNFFLTRSLAAYAIQYMAQIDPEVASKSIVDGSKDNGIDAIYYDERSKVLYLVQSKWIHDGNGEPDNGDIKKFIVGIKDLINLRFEVFNEKVNKLKDIIKKAMTDVHTKIQVVLVYTGINLDEPSRRDFSDLIAEINDANEVLSFSLLNQSRLHDSLKIGIAGEPINLTIGVKEWGKTEQPFKAFYGQVNGCEISDWWNKYENRLFSKNLRELIGETEINRDMRQTIEEEPEKFWYFNNGITIVCKAATKTIIGGGDNTFGQFFCEDISIVNGAQTVGTIGRFSINENSTEKLSKVFVPTRIISLENCPEDFGNNITKNNNKQNKIENRDFVALDPEQSRIQTELAIDGITYYIMRSEISNNDEKSFDLVESTTALACASSSVGMVVQLKREIGKLWENIEKVPYKALFNPSVSGLYVWRVVQFQRFIDNAINELSNDKENRDYGVAIHGNRIISHLIFSEVNPQNFKDITVDFNQIIADYDFSARVNLNYDLLKHYLIEFYGETAVIPTLFKNQTKCEKLVSEIQKIKLN